ncbi:hypothetical protein [Streptomyces sp. DSM 40907]|uniref:hypothetical protein n=1 Tax=Streptomyces kutzneri TaxID=3051179 RepID=UPI0028D770F0|nr:hypothetical protein [Streptomyces sp. DSM 40907]
MTRTTIWWFESLTDSVSALGAAAREARTAHRAAQAATAHYSFNRLQPVDGEITVPGNLSTIPSRPHDRALFAIGQSHHRHEQRMADLYDDAAAGYAYGAAWAILRVLDGHQPPLVELGRKPDGRNAIPDELFPVPPAFKALDPWDGHQRFEQARQELERLGELWAYVNDIDSPDIPDTFNLPDALDDLDAFPDAAFTYGQIAEFALTFTLLDTRQQHGR